MKLNAPPPTADLVRIKNNQHTHSRVCEQFPDSRLTRVEWKIKLQVETWETFA